MTIEMTIIIALGEALFVALLVILFLLKKAGMAKDEIHDLNEKIEALHGQAFQAKYAESIEKVEPPPPPPPAPEPTPPPPQLSLVDLLEEQIDATRDYHEALEGAVDIALDLDPEAPDSRRAAAFRHAILIAEKEALSFEEGQVNWQFLASRYEQILEFQKLYANKEAAEDFGMDTSLEDEHPELVELREELENARKRITNLERFKTLYFELEAKWGETKVEADVCYEELKAVAATSESGGDLTGLLDKYKATYEDLGDIIINRTQGDEVTLDTQATISELRRLRNMTTEQHHLIADLQEKLAKEQNENDKVQIIENLRNEFQKQSRFLEESETCVKLLEEQLSSAQSEIDSLQAQLKGTKHLNNKVAKMEYDHSKHQHLIQSLTQEKRKLAEKLRQAESSGGAGGGSASSAEVTQLELATARAVKELKAMEAKYAELEERYLDLKLQG